MWDRSHRLSALSRMEYFAGNSLEKWKLWQFEFCQEHTDKFWFPFSIFSSKHNFIINITKYFPLLQSLSLSLSSYCCNLLHWMDVVTGHLIYPEIGFSGTTAPNPEPIFTLKYEPDRQRSSGAPSHAQRCLPLTSRVNTKSGKWRP